MKITVHTKNGDIELDLEMETHREALYTVLGKIEASRQLEKLNASLDSSGITLISGD